jgi:hypothetical protein
VTLPLVGPTTLAMLQRAARGTLIHETTLESPETIRIPGSAGQYTTLWTARRPEPGRLRVANPTAPSTRTDQLAEVGDWILSLQPGAQVTVGDRAMVRGAVRGPQGKPVAWQRLVRVKIVPAPEADETVREVVTHDEDLQRA